MTIIKLGGGLIAPKEWGEETVDFGILGRLVGEIRESGKPVLLVSGSGNFGHKAAKKYGITSLEGVVRVRESARKIGKIVETEMKKVGFDTHLVEMHKYLKREQDLDLENTMVFYGDVVEVKSGKWKIFSGEKIIGFIIPILIEQGFKIEKIVQVSKEQGVWDDRRKIILGINQRNWEQIKKNVLGSEGMDVTGGMLHKVQESLEIARKYKIKTWIISGNIEGRLRELLEGKMVLGTVVG